MTGLDRILIALAAWCAVTLGITTWQLSNAKNTLNQQRTTIAQQKDTLLAQSAALATLQDNARRNEQAQLQLRAKLAQAGKLAATRDQQLTRLLNENEDLRRWFGATLPDDIKRLHQRPAFDGPDTYLRWLSAGTELPDTGQQPAHQRRSEHRQSPTGKRTGELCAPGGNPQTMPGATSC